MKHLLILLLPLASYCQDCSIERNYDKFKEQTTVSIKDKRIGISPLGFTKVVKGSDTTYGVMFILIAGGYVNPPKGLYVIFENGVKWADDIKPIGVKYAGTGTYMYYCELIVDRDKVLLMMDNRITDFKMGDKELSVKPKDADYFMCGVEKVYYVN